MDLCTCRDDGIGVRDTPAFGDERMSFKSKIRLMYVNNQLTRYFASCNDAMLHVLFPCSCIVCYCISERRIFSEPTLSHNMKVGIKKAGDGVGSAVSSSCFLCKNPCCDLYPCSWSFRMVVVVVVVAAVRPPQE